ncbi:MAG: capsule assembly Wzi family protein [Spirochaetaceae bacterium]|nr:capsule assembly Wzi family protein [Spirochaetaceae bacterium]
MLPLLFFFCGAFLFADPFTMISAGDPLLEDLRSVVRFSGKSFLSLTPPLSRDEVIAILDEIDPNSLPEPERLRYNRVFENLFPALTYDSPEFAAAIHLHTALEVRFRSNTDIPWLKKDNTNQALLGIPIHLFFTNRVELFFEPQLAADPWYYSHPVSSWGHNVPWESARFDLNVPLRAFIATGGSWWNFQLGRDKLSFGPGRTGNLAVSDNPDYYDFARLSFFSRMFKYSVLVSQMPLAVIGQDGKSLVEDPDILIKDTSEPDSKYLTETMNRYFYLHRFDIKPSNKFSIGLSEGVMIGNAPLELRYLNPVMVFHSFFAWKDYPKWGNAEGDMIGSLLSLDVEWAFIPGWALYGQMVMNEFSTPYERNIAADLPPSGMGYLLGAEYVFDRSGWSLSCFAELVYTDPFLYTLSSPFGSMIWMRRSSDMGNKDLRYAWFGHGEGRDMFLAALGVSAVTEKLSLSANLSVKLQGEHKQAGEYGAWDWDTKHSSQTSPSGTPVIGTRLLLGAGYKFLSSLTVSGHLGGTALFDADHIKGESKYGIEAGLKAAYYF